MQKLKNNLNNNNNNNNKKSNKIKLLVYYNKVNLKYVDGYKDYQ